MLRKILIISLFLVTNCYADFPPVKWTEMDADPVDYPVAIIMPVDSLEKVSTGLKVTFVGVGGSGAPTTADYLTGTTQSGLSAEIVVGATPGGELGGTWASPTVDSNIHDDEYVQLTDAFVGDVTGTYDATVVGDDSHNHIYSNIDSTTSANWALQVSDEQGTGAWTFASGPVVTLAQGTKLPFVSGNLTLDEVGKVGIDITNKQLAVFDGTTEFAIPLRHVAQGTFDLAAQWDVDSDLWLVDLHADQYPNGIYITAIYVDCTVADPTTELDANLMYCDAVAGGAFPGATATLIKAVDTTTGNFSDTAVNTTVATGKTIYLDIDADPTDATTQYHIRIHYFIEED